MGSPDFIQATPPAIDFTAARPRTCYQDCFGEGYYGKGAYDVAGVRQSHKGRYVPDNAVLSPDLFRGPCTGRTRWQAYISSLREFPHTPWAIAERTTLGSGRLAAFAVARAPECPGCGRTGAIQPSSILLDVVARIATTCAAGA